MDTNQLLSVGVNVEGCEGSLPFQCLMDYLGHHLTKETPQRQLIWIFWIPIGLFHVSIPEDLKWDAENHWYYCGKSGLEILSIILESGDSRLQMEAAIH